MRLGVVWLGNLCLKPCELVTSSERHPQTGEEFGTLNLISIFIPIICGVKIGYRKEGKWV